MSVFLFPGSPELFLLTKSVPPPFSAQREYPDISLGGCCLEHGHSYPWRSSLGSLSLTVFSISEALLIAGGLLYCSQQYLVAQIIPHTDPIKNSFL